jgi:FixJ family two-component response regulator
VFASAEEFLNSNHLSDNDCLILDVRMPGMNGLELQRRLAASHMSIPVIFITAHGDEEARVRALNRRRSGILTQTIQRGSVIEAIDRLSSLMT